MASTDVISAEQKQSEDSTTLVVQHPEKTSDFKAYLDNYEFSYAADVNGTELVSQFPAKSVASDEPNDPLLLSLFDEDEPSRKLQLQAALEVDAASYELIVEESDEDIDADYVASADNASSDGSGVKLSDFGSDLLSEMQVQVNENLPNADNSSNAVMVPGTTSDDGELATSSEADEGTDAGDAAAYEAALASPSERSTPASSPGPEGRDPPRTVEPQHTRHQG